MTDRIALYNIYSTYPLKQLIENKFDMQFVVQNKSRCDFGVLYIPFAVLPLIQQCFKTDPRLLPLIIARSSDLMLHMFSRFYLLPFPCQ